LKHHSAYPEPVKAEPGAPILGSGAYGFFVMVVTLVIIKAIYYLAFS
jgi:hypothetical protein